MFVSLISAASWKLCRTRQFRHRLRHKQQTARLCQPPRPAMGFRNPGAVGGDAGIGIHLPIELRNKKEREPRLQRLNTLGALPDRSETIEPVPSSLRELPDLVG